MRVHVLCLTACMHVAVCVCVCVGGGNPEFIPNELAIFLWAIARYTGAFTLPLRKKREHI